VKKYFKITIILFLLFAATVSGQRKVNVSELHSGYVKSENKIKRRNELERELKTFAQKLPDKKNYKKWIQILYKIESLYLQTPESEKIVSTVLQNFDKIPSKLLYTGIETATATFPARFTGIINKIFNSTNRTDIFVIAANYLIRNDFDSRDNEFYLKQIEKRFENRKNDPRLFFFKSYLLQTEKERLKELPELSELLSHEFLPGKTIIFSLFRKNRNYPGITIIRKPDGKFLKTEKDEIFHIPQLGLSYADLPGYLPNGNTPQGIFAVVGWYITPTESIGPTPNVLTRLPFEIDVKEFFHNTVKSGKWTAEQYGKLLPENWRKYMPIYETFYAGKTGRRLLIMHGSTDDLEYYADKPYYPLTPTRGCLSSKEIWDENTGVCIESDQAKLMNAFFSTGKLNGYLVVVNIDDKQKPVEIGDILEFIK